MSKKDVLDGAAASSSSSSKSLLSKLRPASGGGSGERSGGSRDDADSPILGAEGKSARALGGGSPLIGRMSRVVSRISRKVDKKDIAAVQAAAAGMTLKEEGEKTSPKPSPPQSDADADEEETEERQKERTKSFRVPQIKRFPVRVLSESDMPDAKSEHVSTRPIQLSALVDMIECGVDVVDDNDEVVHHFKIGDSMTVHDVNTAVIKPATATASSAFVNALENSLLRDSPLRGHYIVLSHAVNFRLLVKGLLQRFSPEAFVWIDIFSVNQHTWATLPENERKWVTTDLHEAVGRFEGRVVFLDAWIRPDVLKRTWALWEILGFVLSGYAFSFHMEEAVRKELSEKGLRGGEIAALLRSIAEIDVGTSEARDQVDRKLILTRVEDMRGGSAGLARVVRERLVRFLQTSCTQELDEARRSEDKEAEARLEFSLVKIQAEVGDVVGSLKTCRAAIAHGEQVFGKASPQVASLLEDAARGCMAVGSFSDALVYREKLLNVEVKLYGADHVNVAADHNNLGRVLEITGDFGKASFHYGTALGIFRKLENNAKSATIATALNNLGASLANQEKFAEAETSFREADAIWQEIRGAAHPDTLTTRAWLADVLQSQQKLADALPLLEEVWELRKKVLGVDNPDTVASLANLVCCLEDSQSTDTERLAKLTAELNELDARASSASNAGSSQGVGLGQGQGQGQGQGSPRVGGSTSAHRRKTFNMAQGMGR